jgi:hypothetical protein
METLLEYLLKMPPEGCSHDRGHKHPFTVSELFAQEVGQINDMFFTAPPKGHSKTALGSPNKEEIKLKETPEKNYDAVKVGIGSSSSSDDEDSSSSEEFKAPEHNP